MLTNQFQNQPQIKVDMYIVIIVTECLDAKEYRNAKKSNVNILLGQDTVIGP